MKWFLNLRLTTKLVASFTVTCVLTAALGIFSIHQLGGLNHHVDEMTLNWMPATNAAGGMATAFSTFRVKELRHILSNTKEGYEEFEKHMAEVREELEKHEAVYKPLIANAEEQKLYDEFHHLHEDYFAENIKVVELSRAGKKDEALALMAGKSQQLFTDTLAKLHEIYDLNVKGGEHVTDLAHAEYASAWFWIVSVLCASVVIGMFLAVFIARIISKPVRRLAEVANELAIGDIEQTVDINTREELGTLADAFRKIVDAQKSLTAAAGRIAAGDMSVQVVERSEKDQLSKSFQQLQGAVRGLVDETREIVTAASQGQLDKRGDASSFQGAYRELVQGFNQTLDAVIEPVTEAANVLSQVAQRDLTVRVEGQYQGDHAKIKNALNTALDNLEEALGQAATGAEQVTSAATQISNGSQALAQGASEQASSLEEVSSSLEEMASMTKQNAENSNQGKLLAGEARSAADRGNDAMTRMAGAIDKIKSSSDATAKIVKTIDEIAFQTNLLALNAAVEAARAGEAGKGFAVVAEEVRNLAQRSAEAAKNTANMIEESVKNADGGVRITEEVAKALGEISEASHKVNDLVAEIAAASAEQSKGIEQINLAVNQLDKVTQQNAANSEESASAAEELNSQSVSLSQTVGQFRLRSTKTTPVVEKQGKIASELTTSTKRTRKSSERELVGTSRSNGKLLPLDEEDFKGF